VPLGQWSDWLQVKFRAGMLVSLRGMVRFHLLALDPELRLYASPVNFDPAAPLFPISHPAHFAGDLADEIGPYHTTGMVEDHTGLNNERLTEDAFLQQCDQVWRERSAMMQSELSRFDEGLFYCLYDTPDRVQHLFWRYREPSHPANRGRTQDPALARVIEDQYRLGDAVVGQALEHADDQTLLIALSDHGFGSFQRGVDLNAWLHEQGLLALTDGREPGAHAGDLLQGVDWSRTKAYALGLSGLYINLAGREAQGIVPPDEAESLKAAIAAGLTGLVDPERGAVAINAALPREALYTGPHVSEAPDLLVHYNAGYRVGWASSMGGVGAAVFEDNTKLWAGDHIIDPALVPGFLAANHPLRADGARLIDLAPTILDALGVAKGGEMEGDTLLS
jgi:predicted AlkP superfamily phosphohydrolase/phosphomutase